MPEDYSVRLVARQEGLEYRAGSAVYRFDVLLSDGAWRVYLPCSKGEDCAEHELTEDEAAEILPRVVSHLECDRLFGIPIRRYGVQICRHPAS